VWTKFEDPARLIIFLSIVFALVSATVAAYFLSSEKTRRPVRRLASWIAAVISTLVALVATIAFAIPVLEDLRNPNVQFRGAMLGAAIVWAICLCAWVIATRCIIFAVRRDSLR